MINFARTAFGSALLALPFTVPVTGAALAQNGPTMSIKTDETRRLSPEEQEKRDKADEAYREAIKKTPTVQQKKVDPWGSVRSVDKTAKER
jgi:hypothetical protein